jgi:hypothetical protein
MTDSEANNHSSSLPKSAPGGHSWNWLTERLPASGVERLGTWIEHELALLETPHADSITARSRQRDQRHEFASSRRTTETEQIDE